MKKFIKEHRFEIIFIICMLLLAAFLQYGGTPIERELKGSTVVRTTDALEVKIHWTIVYKYHFVPVMHKQHRERIEMEMDNLVFTTFQFQMSAHEFISNYCNINNSIEEITLDPEFFGETDVKKSYEPFEFLPSSATTRFLEQLKTGYYGDSI